MRIVFFGTPLFAAEALSYLLDREVDVVGIVTQPDRPKGRSLQVAFSPVKEVFLEKAPNISLFQPEKASDPRFIEEITQLKADLFVVVAYGQILTQKLLDVPKKGAINLHASLLPKFRGAAPIQRAILAGETITGISIQKMVRAMDAGDILISQAIEIAPDMNAGELERVLLEESKPLLLKVIQNFSALLLKAAPQDPTKVSFAPKIELEEGEIRWNLSAKELDRLVRGFAPKPGAWAWISQNPPLRLKILRVRIQENPSFEPVGTLLLPHPLVVCKEEVLELMLVQPEGKKAMTGQDWVRGIKNFTRFPINRPLA